MRMIMGLLLLTGLTSTAVAHTGDGVLLTALSHQLFGLHHLPFSILLVAGAVFVVHRWHSSKRRN